jgi:hypothetical protein
VLLVLLQDAAFFDHNNPVGLAERERAFQLALADMMKYLRSESGQVAIFDATNSTQERREKLVSGLHEGMGVRAGAQGGGGERAGGRERPGTPCV